MLKSNSLAGCGGRSARTFDGANESESLGPFRLVAFDVSAIKE